ncbi:MAG TPA: HAD family hydrolase [Candidatus Wildermuthbacteria bacterium]|nr:HAD family hydrolase [Candidatus Wildermuthbacteria bacterium]
MSEKQTQLPFSSWHAITLGEAIRNLKTNAKTGLTASEVKKRRKKYGSNKLPEEQVLSPVLIFFRQFKSPLILILVIAGVVTLVLGEYTDSAVIFGAVFLNTLIGYFQENKAIRALSALKKILTFTATVLREGKIKEIPQVQLVPGDIMMLRAGIKIPADGRILQTLGMQIGEAILTGEWISSQKNTKILPVSTPLADRDNMVYMGSVIENGEGMAVVVNTGDKTELGQIASLVSEIEEEKTPYQRRLSRLSWIIGVIVSALALFIFVEGIVTHLGFAEMFITAVAIAVAAIPEGLPVAMTIILALGMQEILKKNGLVRNLASAETLGSTTVIATDKTLTLTEGTMEVTEVSARPSFDKELVLVGAALANEGYVENPEEVFEKQIIRGRPTDKGLLQAAMNAGLSSTELEKKYPLLHRISFDPVHKYVASFHKYRGNTVAFVSGAPESVISISKCTEQELNNIKSELNRLTGRGLRVIAVAQKDIQGSNPGRADLTNLKFVGFIGLKDPIRKEAKGAIREAKRAGIRTIIVTGDHMLTALAAAKELGLPCQPNNILEGKELEKMSEETLDNTLERISIYARVEPVHKLRIIEAWQKRGETIAMTGDGVNDAPALKRADIGIAIGSGTDVAKEVADLILLGDNFNIIPAAIRQGRIIIDNIRKVITFLLSGSFTETILIGTAIILGFPLPITALQILWINIVEDGLPGIALAFEKGEKDVMKRKPEAKNKGLLTNEMKVIIFAISFITDLILLGLFFFLLKTEYTLEHIQTIIFIALGLDSIFYVFACKSLRKNIWEYNIFSNKFLTGSVILGIFLLLLPIYLPVLQNVFHTVPLSLLDWGVLVTLAIINLLLIEATKWYFIQKMRRKPA